MLENLDQQLLLYLNSHNSPLWDQLMYILSGKVIWIPLYVALLVSFWYRKSFWVLVIAIALTMTLSDRLSVAVKNTVKRPRPCHELMLEGKVHTVKGECGGKYGFVSSHATNSFAVAMLGLLLLRKRWLSVSLITWALVIGYSRIYLGVHYPGDVIGGSILGILTGWGGYGVFKIILSKYFSESGNLNSSV